MTDDRQVNADCPATTGLAETLVAAVRQRRMADLSELFLPSAMLHIDQEASEFQHGAANVDTVLNHLSAGQRAGLMTLGNAARTVIVAPAQRGRPETRKILVFSHPDQHAVAELHVYTDDTPLDDYPGGAYPQLGTRLSAVPHYQPSEYDWARQRVLVTASSGGLGFAMANTFLEKGGSVAFHGLRDAIRLPKKSYPGKAVYISADLASAAGRELAVEKAAEALGGHITILVNNYGPWDAAPVTAESRQVMASLDTHVGAALHLSELVAPGMTQSGWGRIINISAASAVTRQHGSYGFGKATLEIATQYLALELSPHVTVNAISPGQIEQSAEVMDVIDPTENSRTLHRTPLGRFVTHREVAHAAVALCDGPFGMLTGAVLPLDGGYRLGASR